MDTPGVEIVGPMHVFGEDDAPHGHMHLRFTDVRVPESNILLGEGRGFEISQVRLGPGRIHHCMRSVGAAERALELMAKRGSPARRSASGSRTSARTSRSIAKARIEIEAMRRMVLTAAKAMDELGNAEARVWVSAGQGDGARSGCARSSTRRSRSTAPPASRSGPRSPGCTRGQRTLRLADGPDEVHWHVVGRSELASWEPAAAGYDPKVAYYAEIDGTASETVFSGP